MSRSLNQLLERGDAGATAIAVPGGPSLTYARLRGEVTRAAQLLAELGLRRGDRIASVLPNSAETIVMFLAASTTGTVAPLNPAYKEDEFRFYLEDVAARALIVPPGGGEAARRARPEGCRLVEASLDAGAHIVLTGEGPTNGQASPAPADDDVALVLHTSGTTSRPKQVPLRHRHLHASALNIAATYRLAPDDVAMCVMPLFHIHGLMASTMATLSSGGTVVVPPAFDAMNFWQAVNEHRATWYSAVPTIHQMLLLRNRGERPAGAERLRFIRSSSSALSPETMRQLESRFGAPVLEAYGMTEASHQMASNPLPPAERRAGTVGIETGIRIGIMGEKAGRLMARGDRGEVVIQGPTVLDGYANNPEANAQSFVDGWFRTGDQGYLDPDGYLSLVGRLKEMINRGGEKIAPREVDDVLLQHPAVAEAVAFGSPHPAWGEEVAAAVVLKGSATEKELIAFARERLADHKVPKKLYLVDQIPRTPTGKIQRRAVAEAFNAR